MAASAPRKRSPAVAARAEARKTNPPPIKVTFRRETFDIPRDRLGSARVLLAQRSGELHSLLYELLGSRDADRFIRLCGEGESIWTVAAEFLKAFNKAAGVPNS